MPFFIVSMTHPDKEGRKKHLGAHVMFLQSLVQERILLASGPLLHTEEITGFLILSASSKDDVQGIIARDPFSIADLIGELQITEWDPVFGAFRESSSGQLSGYGPV